MRIFAWHVHDAWMTAFVQGPHEYFLPVLNDRGPYGRGRVRTHAWPKSVQEVPIHELADLDPDVMVLQRPEELEHACAWLGRRPGLEIPTVYVEHGTARGALHPMRHPLADHPELTLVHVTHFNDVFWDSGSTPTRVIEHGIVDPGRRYQGDLPCAAAVVNEAERRARASGSDLLKRFAAVAPVDLFGIGSEKLGGLGDLPTAQLHGQLARRRLYLHLNRWTSPGLSLIEAMHLGMPVVALASTELPAAVPAEAGTVSTRIEALEAAVRTLVREPELAREMGLAARRAARKRYGLERFLRDWDVLFEEIAA
jgi:hypothetical protein